MITREALSVAIKSGADNYWNDYYLGRAGLRFITDYITDAVWKVVEPEVVATVGTTKSTKSVTINPDD